MELLEFGGTISDCVLANNRCAPKGGAVFLTVKAGETCDLLNTTFEGNQASSSSELNHFGGAICVEGDFIGEVSGCDFLDNTANASRFTSGTKAYGGGIFIDGDLISRGADLLLPLKAR